MASIASFPAVRTGWPIALPACLCLVCLSFMSHAQEPSDPTTLKQLSIEELMNVEVTSVSRRSEKIGKTASAIQVITRDDIIKSGATSLPEALQLTSNLQVAQISAQHWIISARGFNSVFANKLLVMINGRTVYTPLFAGVFWDAQSILLEDIDRIEVISGPGGTMWGANAVNGVINIITKKASETTDSFARVGAGTQFRNMVEGRVGGALGSNGAYRFYLQHYNRAPTRVFADGSENQDGWDFAQVGFRTDWTGQNNNEYTVEGNFHRGIRKTSPESTIDGQNLRTQWHHPLSPRSHLSIQAYADRTWRDDVPSAIKDELLTLDLDLQHNVTSGSHEVVWGLGYRYMDDKTINTLPVQGFYPRDRSMDLFSFFVQDEISLSERFRLVVGTKIQHNVFSGWDWQPGARVSVSLGDPSLIWASASRSVRSPSRIDVDYHIPAEPLPPDMPSVAGGPDFVSEKLVAYELGYRLQPSPTALLSIALFHHEYDDLYSVENVPGTLTYQIMNGSAGSSRGVELSGQVRPTADWKLRGGYTFFEKKLRNKPGNDTDEAALANLGSDARNIASLQSIFTFNESLNLTVGFRFVDELPPTQFIENVPAYFEMNARIAWKFGDFEVALAGQNLLHRYHREYPAIEIPRNIYGTIAWRP